MDRSRTPPPRSGLPSQPCQHGLLPFPPVPPPPPRGASLPVFTLGSMPGLAKTIFPGHSLTSFPGSPGSQTKAPAPEPLSFSCLRISLIPMCTHRLRRTRHCHSTTAHDLACARGLVAGQRLPGHPSQHWQPQLSSTCGVILLGARERNRGHSCHQPAPRPLPLPGVEQLLAQVDCRRKRRTKAEMVLAGELLSQIRAQAAAFSRCPSRQQHRPWIPRPLHSSPCPWQQCRSLSLAPPAESSSPNSTTKSTAAPALAGQNLRQLPLQFSPGSNLGTPTKPEPSSIMQPQEGSPWLTSHFPAKCHDKELKAWINSLTLNDRKKSELQDWLKQVED